MARVLDYVMRVGALLTAPSCVAPARVVDPPIREPRWEERIDDGEDGDGWIAKEGGRDGGWCTFADQVGSSVWPAPVASAGVRGCEGQPVAFTMSKGGREPSRFAARVTGTVAKAPVVYTALAFDFRQPRGPYDASAYSGVSFDARRGPSATGKVRFMVSGASTDPAGGRCTECFNHFGADLQVTDAWQRYVFPFGALRQLSGWGAPRPPRLESDALFSLVWQTQDQGAAVDLWIDNVAFIPAKG